MFYHVKKQNVLRFCAVLVLICLAFLGCATISGSRTDYPELTFPKVPEQTTPPADTRPRVALTFDDGPSSITTKPIVDELNKYGFHATFFVVGDRVDLTPDKDNGADAMIYAVENGNEIGIHAYTHDMSIRYDTCTQQTYEYEIYETLKAIQSKIPGYEVRLMRPIGGAISNERVASCPFAVVNWSIDTMDWSLRSPAGDEDQINTIVENALSGIEDGDIILLHDIYNNTYEATVILLARLHEMGFNVVTVSELLGNDLCPGTKYTHG